MAYKNEPQERLWKRFIEPGYDALAKVLSHESGRTIFMLMADAYRGADSLAKVWHENKKSHATRREQRDYGSYEHTLGLLNAYRYAIAFQMEEASGGKFSYTTAINIINRELYEYVGF